MISERDLYRRAFDTLVDTAPTAPDFDDLGTLRLTPLEPAKRRWPLAVAAIAALVFAVSPLFLMNSSVIGPASPGTTPGVATTTPCPTTTTPVGVETTTTWESEDAPPPDLGQRDDPCYVTTTVGIPTSTMPPSTTTTSPPDDGQG